MQMQATFHLGAAIVESGVQRYIQLTLDQAVQWDKLSQEQSPPVPGPHTADPSPPNVVPDGTNIQLRPQLSQNVPKGEPTGIKPLLSDHVVFMTAVGGGQPPHMLVRFQTYK